MNISFYAGETKEISARITPVNADEIVIISSAYYEFTNCKNEIISRGFCNIQGDEISLLLSTPSKGSYTLKITAQIGPETIIEKANIFVGE